MGRYEWKHGIEERESGATGADDLGELSQMLAWRPVEQMFPILIYYKTLASDTMSI